MKDDTGIMSSFSFCTRPAHGHVNPMRRAPDFGGRDSVQGYRAAIDPNAEKLRGLAAWWLDLDEDRTVVLLTQGAVRSDPNELIRPALEGLSAEDLLVMVTTGGSEITEALPANARVGRFVSYHHLLPTPSGMPLTRRLSIAENPTFRDWVDSEERSRMLRFSRLCKITHPCSHLDMERVADDEPWVRQATGTRRANTSPDRPDGNCLVIASTCTEFPEASEAQVGAADRACIS
jgi:hypothetical protein